MNEAVVIGLMREALTTALLVGAPILALDHDHVELGFPEFGGERCGVERTLVELSHRMTP